MGSLLRDRFPVTERVALVPVPAVVVLGTADEVVPPDQSRRVAEAAAVPVHLVEVAGAGHNDAALLDGPALVKAVIDLADRVAGSGDGG
jgi:pimeloyl-ACP methyl ester carboxylesterase